MRRLALLGLIILSLGCGRAPTALSDVPATSSPSPIATETPSPSPTPTSTPTEVATANPTMPAQPQSAPPAIAHPPPPPTNWSPCPGLVITSFTAKLAIGERGVDLAWTSTGGCGSETTSIKGQTAIMCDSWSLTQSGTRSGSIHDQTDHTRPHCGYANQCAFNIRYDIWFNFGMAPDGGPARPATVQIDNVPMCW
jgi:hypothetical protein